MDISTVAGCFTVDLDGGGKVHHVRLAFGGVALVFDAVWMAMQMQSWWVPYAFGTSRAWQLAYAKGRTTKVLPSFGAHVAPDGMHLVISVLLVASIAVSLRGLYRLRQEERAA